MSDMPKPSTKEDKSPASSDSAKGTMTLRGSGKLTLGAGSASQPAPDNISANTSDVASEAAGEPSVRDSAPASRPTLSVSSARSARGTAKAKPVQVEVKRTRSFSRGATLASSGSSSLVREPSARNEADNMVTDNPLAGLTEHERQARLRAVEGAKREEEQRRHVEAAQQRLRAQEVLRKAEESTDDSAQATDESKPESAELPGAELSELSESAPDTQITQTQSAQTQSDADHQDQIADIPATNNRAASEQEADKLSAKPAAAPQSDSPQSDAPQSDSIGPDSGAVADRSGKTDAKSDKSYRHSDDDGEGERSGGKRHKSMGRVKGEPKRRVGKLTISRALTEEDEDAVSRGRSLAALKRAREKERQRHKQMTRAEKVIRDVIITDTITVADLANRMAERGADVVKKLFGMGVVATINQTIDGDTAQLVVEEFGHRVKRVFEGSVEDALVQPPSVQGGGNPVARAPVVTIMGHVDHGKTSLLDALRTGNVAAGEAGGITQHIGAYRVTHGKNSSITFLDTPGHEAFTAMRQRGATVTDIVVLVVAADDGVKPQTIEAISHAKAAKAPIIVAINKMDAPGADPERVKNELLSYELIAESMGGDVQTVEVSALKKTNLDVLLEAITLQAEIMELKADPKEPARGTVVEAKQIVGRGSVATVLVQSGTLKQGDIFVAGQEWGRVKAMTDESGSKLKQAGPAVPVEVLGFQSTPKAGDEFIVLADDAKAREIAEYRQTKAREEQLAGASRTSLDQMFAKIKDGEAAELPIVVKADVHGSLEAIAQSMGQLSTDEVKVTILHSGVGAIAESDVNLAYSSGGMVIGFNVRANPQARDLAKREGVDIRYYSVIYGIIEDVTALLSGLLAPDVQEVFLGRAEVREIFSISRVGRVAGVMVTEGEVRRGSKVRILRDDIVVYEGSLRFLKRHKDDAREVRQGFECGMTFENFGDIHKGDMVECFDIQETARQL